MFDPHGGPRPPSYAPPAMLASEIAEHGGFGDSARVRFGRVTARTAASATDTATVTVNGIPMPYLQSASPQVDDYVAWLEQDQVRLVLGKYGHDIPRWKGWLLTPISLVPNTVATPGPISWDGTQVIEFQQSVIHSQGFLSNIVTIGQAGVYDVAGSMTFAPGDGLRFVYLKINGVIEVEAGPGIGSVLFNTQVSFAMPYRLTSTTTLELLYVHNNSTGNINAVIGPGRSYLSAVRRAGFD